MSEEAEPTTETVAGPNDAQGTANNDESLSPGIKQRLDRFERKLTKEKIEPLTQQLERIRNTVVEQGLDLATFGFESAPAAESQPTKQDAGPSQDTIKLMRLQAAYNADLPQESLPLITATTEEDILAQVNAIKSLNPRGSRIRSPIPQTGPNGSPLPSFKRSQLRDGKFYMEHLAEIQAAQKAGRIIDDIR